MYADQNVAGQKLGLFSVSCLHTVPAGQLSAFVFLLNIDSNIVFFTKLKTLLKSCYLPLHLRSVHPLSRVVGSSIWLQCITDKKKCL